MTDRQQPKQRDHKPRRILAVASGGGHWVQLLRLRPAFEGQRVAYATVRAEYRQDVPGSRLFVIPDATRWSKLALVRQAATLAWIMLRVRPHVVISTGAAPGYFAIRLGRLVGARTCWIDSIANVEHLSMTGQIIGKHAHLWLTQWPHLATPNGPACVGSVL